MIVANASGGDEAYVVWMVFASLVVVGLSTLLQVRRLGFVGAGAVLPMFTAAFAIPFCITAVADGGPATLTTLLLVSAGAQLAISRWLFILRRVVTPTVSGTVMMILSITLASVVFDLLDDATQAEPEAASLTAFVTMVVAAALALRRSPLLRFWGPSSASSLAAWWPGHWASSTRSGWPRRPGWGSRPSGRSWASTSGSSSGRWCRRSCSSA